MEARNLTEQNVNELQKKMEEMTEGNPDLTYRFFNQDDEPQTLFEKVNKIQSDLEELKAKIDLIFGGAVLINGQFQEINKLK